MNYSLKTLAILLILCTYIGSLSDFATLYVSFGSHKKVSCGCGMGVSCCCSQQAEGGGCCSKDKKASVEKAKQASGANCVVDKQDCGRKSQTSVGMISKEITDVFSFVIVHTPDPTIASYYCYGEQILSRSPDLVFHPPSHSSFKIIS